MIKFIKILSDDYSTSYTKYINIDHILSFGEIAGGEKCVISLINGERFYTKQSINIIKTLIEKEQSKLKGE